MIVVTSFCVTIVNDRGVSNTGKKYRSSVRHALLLMHSGAVLRGLDLLMAQGFVRIREAIRPSACEAWDCAWKRQMSMRERRRHVNTSYRVREDNKQLIC